MFMARYVEGSDRRQSFLLPACVDDYVGDDNPVRVVDAFVDGLDLAELGFGRTTPANTGRPGYRPATLLKLYIYGYLNRVPSSRRLEREAQRNLEVLWLTGRLAPDFKTIADFRRDNGPAIKATCRQFVALCRELDLFSDTLVAVDGSKFKAVNSRDKSYSQSVIQRRMEQVDASISRYLAALDTADRHDPDVPSGKVQRLREKLDKLKEQMRHLREMEAVVAASPDGQVSLTDPDAGAMTSAGRGTTVVGYNVQAAVDTTHHLIVAHEVTNIGNDRGQLAQMGRQAQKAIGRTALTVLADRGYYSGRQVLECTDDGMVPYVPKPLTSGAKAEDRFGKQDFVYLAKQDAYRCPAGERLTWRFNNIENGMTLRCYWTSGCATCAIKSHCTTGKERRIKRWEHEGVLDAMQKRLDQVPQAMILRRQTVEHPFGTIKAWMGSTHFLTKSLKRVSTEMSLQVLAYNMKRVIAILGVRPLREAIQA
jgi:transposase